MSIDQPENTKPQHSNTPDSKPVEQRKSHNYTRYQAGSDYLFELIEQGAKGYMTGQGKGVKPGDYILLQLNDQLERFQVENIEYYSNPSTMWIALLVKVNGDS